MIGLIGKKLGQTRVYDETGEAICVTVVQAGPNYVVQKKTTETDGYDAVQLGFDEQKPRRLTKALVGHYEKSKATPSKRLKEFRDFEGESAPGNTVDVDIFKKGDRIDVIGTTKGHGFQGTMKRWNYGGGPRTHGQKGFVRRPGSIGHCQWPGEVQKGKKMPGHMGQRRRTVQNLQVVDVLNEDHLILVQGAIPGAKGDYVVIRSAVKKKRGAQ